MSQVCSQIVLKCLYLARIGRPDILWSVNKLARSITKWTKACDKGLSRLISFHHTCEYKQYCFVGNTAKQCRLGLFQDSDIAGDLEDSKSTSGGTLCIFGSHTFFFQSVGCVRNKLQFHTVQQNPKSSLWTLDWDGTGFSHVIYGIWLFFVLGNTTQNHDWTEKPVVCRDASHAQGQQSRGMFNVLNNVDRVPSNVQFSHQEALLYVFEDNEAVIKMILKERSPTMRHVSRTHWVALDWLFDRIYLDPKIQSSTLTPKTNSQTC